MELLRDRVAAGEGSGVGQGVVAGVAVRRRCRRVSSSSSSSSSSPFRRKEFPRQRAPEGPLPQPFGVAGVRGQVLERDLLEAGQRRLPVAAQQVRAGRGGGRLGPAAEGDVGEDEAPRLQEDQHCRPGGEALPGTVALGDAGAVFQDDVGDDTEFPRRRGRKRVDFFCCSFRRRRRRSVVASAAADAVGELGVKEPRGPRERRRLVPFDVHLHQRDPPVREGRARRRPDALDHRVDALAAGLDDEERPRRRRRRRRARAPCSSSSPFPSSFLPAPLLELPVDVGSPDGGRAPHAPLGDGEGDAERRLRRRRNRRRGVVVAGRRAADLDAGSEPGVEQQRRVEEAPEARDGLPGDDTAAESRGEERVVAEVGPDVEHERRRRRRGGRGETRQRRRLRRRRRERAAGTRADSLEPRPPHLREPALDRAQARQLRRDVDVELRVRVDGDEGRVRRRPGREDAERRRGGGGGSFAACAAASSAAASELCYRPRERSSELLGEPRLPGLAAAVAAVRPQVALDLAGRRGVERGGRGGVRRRSRSRRRGRI